jgi:hypothetical protein
MRKSMPLALRAAPSKPAMIEDDDNNVDHPPLPISIRGHTRNQFVCPSHARPTTQSQLQAQTRHMINCVIAAELMPLALNPTSTPPAAIGYAFAAHQLAIKNHVAHHSLELSLTTKPMTSFNTATWSRRRALAPCGRQALPTRSGSFFKASST